MTATAAQVETREKYGFYIDGEESFPTSGETFESTNPATGEVWADMSLAGAEDVDRAVKAGWAAFESAAWGGLTATRRGRLLMRLADLVAERAEELAAYETRDNGKLYREMTAQFKQIPEYLYYFGGMADKIEGAVVPLDRPTMFGYRVREPLGVVALITPWNSPSLDTMMYTGAALAGGNTLVIKPSEFSSAGFLHLVRLFEEAGFPPGVVNVVTGPAATGAALVNHPGVEKVAFTGGPVGGQAVAESLAARTRGFLLELGGKSPNIVFADADLDAAEAGVFAGIFAATGQTCIAGSRLLVQSEVYDEFVGRLVGRAEQIRLGDPMKVETQMGPVATQPQIEKIAGFVEDARKNGANVATGGDFASVEELPNGLFYKPTIIRDVDPADRLAQQEVFGPVLATMPFTDEAEALAIANSTEYGLAAGLWTRDVKRVHKMAKRLRAGSVWVNTYRAFAPNAPFGGYKSSGIGRKNGIEAVQEFLQSKMVWCELGDEIQDPFIMKT